MYLTHYVEEVTTSYHDRTGASHSTQVLADIVLDLSYFFGPPARYRSFTTRIFFRNLFVYHFVVIRSQLLVLRIRLWFVQSLLLAR